MVCLRPRSQPRACPPWSRAPSPANAAASHRGQGSLSHSWVHWSYFADCFVSAMDSRLRQLLKSDDRCLEHGGRASLLTFGNWPQDYSSFHAPVFSDRSAADPRLCRKTHSCRCGCGGERAGTMPRPAFELTLIAISVEVSEMFEA